MKHPAAAQFLRCLPWMMAALATGTDAALTADDLWARVLSGHAQFWPGPTSVMVTTLHHDERGRFIHVWLGGGNLRDLLAVQPGVEAWARTQGCTFASIDGRKGWARALKRSGFNTYGHELRKEL